MGVKRAVVIGDYTGKIHAVYPVADTFTYDDLNQVKETAEYYNQTADLLDIGDECKCVGEVTRAIAELNGEDTSDTPEEINEALGKCFPVEWDREYTGGDYDGAGNIAYVPFRLLKSKGPHVGDGAFLNGIPADVAHAFEQHTGVNPIHIVHYTFDEVYNSAGDDWEDE